jgi:hypothetical protein
LGLEYAHATGCELDRERETVQTATDLCDGLVGLELWPNRPRSLHEQAYGIVVP